ncbi:MULTISPECIES: FidL-like protein [unclassified Yersinia (in: enterobacteria)]|uniref:FidL-like protein n=1 Tax=unclassified Yersinia (in: enterobacteria) TaxID=2653513 RepID=UPI003B28097B
MKKGYLTVVYLTILAAVAIFWAYQLLPKVVLQCDSELYLKKNINTYDSVSLLADVSIFLSRNGDGFIKFTGTAQDKTSSYILNRALPFNYTTLDNNGVYTVNFTTQIIRAIDDVPDNVWSKFIQTTRDDVQYFVSVKNIDKNLYVINGLSSPVLICATP